VKEEINEEDIPKSFDWEMQGAGVYNEQGSDNAEPSQDGWDNIVVVEGSSS